MRLRGLAAVWLALAVCPWGGALASAAPAPGNGRAASAGASGLPPTLTDDSYVTVMNQALVVAAPGILGNDDDRGDGYLSGYEITSGPANGTLDHAADGSFTYTPNEGFVGADGFGYQVAWPGGDPSVANVAIAVNQRLQLVDDAFETIAGTPLVAPAPGYLGNDTDSGDGVLGAHTVHFDEPETGSLSGIGFDGSFTFTPAAGFVGAAHFTYEVTDGDYAATATVTITVAAGPPMSLQDDSFDALKNVGLGISADQLFANDTVNSADDPLVLADVSQPDHGAIVTDLPGGFAYIAAEDYVGDVSFTYTAALASDPSTTATANVTITVRDTPLIAVDDRAQLDGYLQPLAIDVLANDTITFRDGLIETVGGDPSYGSTTLNADGTITYALDTTWIGLPSNPIPNCWTWSPIFSDAFTYALQDTMDQTAAANVTVSFSAMLCTGHDQPLFDADAIPADVDNCPLATNSDQADEDGDGFGDACDIPGASDGDYDDDGVADAADNCPTVQNADQANADGDRHGDRCDVAAGDEPSDEAPSGEDDEPTVRLPETGVGRARSAGAWWTAALGLAGGALVGLTARSRGVRTRR